MCTCHIMSLCGQQTKWSSITAGVPPQSLKRHSRTQVPRLANASTLARRCGMTWYMHQRTNISSLGKTEQPLVGVLEHVPIPLDSNPDIELYEDTRSIATAAVNAEDESQYGFDFLPPAMPSAVNAAVQLPTQSPAAVQPESSGLQPSVTGQPLPISNMGKRNSKFTASNRRGSKRQTSDGLPMTTGIQPSGGIQQHAPTVNMSRTASDHQGAAEPGSSSQQQSTGRWMASWAEDMTERPQMNTGSTTDDSVLQTGVLEDDKQPRQVATTTNTVDAPTDSSASHHTNRTAHTSQRAGSDTAVPRRQTGIANNSTAGNSRSEANKLENSDKQLTSGINVQRSSSPTAGSLGDDLDVSEMGSAASWGGYVRVRRQQQHEMWRREPQQDAPWWQTPVEQALQSCPKQALAAIQKLSPVLDGGKAYSSAGSNATTLFMKGLPSHAPESLMRAALVAAFERAGPIQQVRLPSVQASDGKRELRGIAYVVFADADAKARAAELVDRQQVLGRWLKCDLQPTADNAGKGRIRQDRAPSISRKAQFALQGDSSIPHRQKDVGKPLQPRGRQRNAKNQFSTDTSHKHNSETGVATVPDEPAAKQKTSTSTGRAAPARRGRFLE